MNKSTAHLAKIKKSLSDLNYTEVISVDDNTAIAKFKDTAIKYVFDRHYDQVEVHITLEGNDYLSGTLFELKEPDYVKHFLPTRKLEGKKKVEAQIKIFGELIQQHCIDILNGDFSFKEEYEKLTKETQFMISKVFAMSRNHPIAAKFWKGDYTWKADFRKLDKK